jgi:ATP-binding cassette, subfamily C, bacterial CydD
MGIALALQDARSLSSLSVRSRGALVACAAFAERLLSPALGYALVSRGLVWALPVGALLGAMLAARGAAQRSFAARTEAELYQRAVAAVLGSDVLQPRLLPDQEARVSLFESLYRISLLLSETLPNLAANAIAALILGVAVLTYQSSRVALVSTIALVAGGAWLFASRRRVDASQTDAWRAWEKVADGVSDACDGRLELVAAGRDHDFLNRFSTATTHWDGKARRAGLVAGLLGRLPIVLLAAAVGATVIADARLAGASWSQAAIPAGLLASTTPAFLGIARCLQELVSNESRLQLVRRVFDGAVADRRGGIAPASSPASLECKAVHFAYEKDGRSVLRDVSFEWRHGEVLALAGPNGSGKSSCVRAILGLGYIVSGAILIDGVPLSSMDPLLWRRKVAFLPQRPYLSPRATAREALRFIDRDTSEDAMRDSIERVGLSQRLRGVTGDPLDAKVGDLSVGERQRLALARVLCRLAPVVVLDEADANLDADGIQLVANLVRELARDRMVLVVAHSAELLERADRIVALEAGIIRATQTFGPGGSSGTTAIQN